MNFNSYKKAFFVCSFIAASMFFAACGDSSTTSQNQGSHKIVEGSVSGVSQKGPFKKGSTVTLFELDENLHQTGHYYETVVNNNAGKYNFDSVSIKGPYAWMVVNGNFINEYTGKTSNRKITLNGLVNLDDGKNININILSHLAFNRIYNLVQQGIPVADAQKQAEKEVIKAFNFEEEDTPFEKMDIFADGEGNAKLLAISLIILNEWINKVDLENWEINTCAEYTDDLSSCDLSDVEEFDKDDGGAIIDLMAQISFDLETDGTWDNDSLKRHIAKTIAKAGKEKYLDVIEPNLKALGAQKVPNFKKYLKKFATPDTLWGKCSEEGVVKMDPIYVATKDKFDDEKSYYEYLHNWLYYGKYICFNGEWIDYKGFRFEGDAPADTAGKYGTFTDERDGHTYKTLDIKLKNGKTATWMASILEYSIPNADEPYVEHIPGIGNTYSIEQFLSPLDTTNHDELRNAFHPDSTYQGLCPDGWHIPKEKEWNELEEAIKDDLQTKELLVYTQYHVSSYGEYGIAFYDINYSIYDNIVNDPESEDVIIPYYEHSIYGYSESGPPYSIRCVKD